MSEEKRYMVKEWYRNFYVIDSIKHGMQGGTVCGCSDKATADLVANALNLHESHTEV